MGTSRRYRLRNRAKTAVLLEDDDRVDLAFTQLAPTAEFGQLQEHANGLHRGTGLLNEADGGRGGPSGGQDVIDHQDARALRNRLGAQLHAGRAVLQGVVQAE